MALEYQLSYTAEDINNRLGTVNENADTLSKVVKDLNTANADIADLILNKVSKTTTVNGKTLDTNITLTAGDVLADPQGSAANALNAAKEYTNEKIANNVSFARSLESGTKIGTITINGENTELYAPSKPSISVNSSKLVITT